MSAAWWARAGCLVAVAFSLAFVPTADAAPLRLDAEFGKGGIARVPFRHVLDIARPLRPVRQPDGKVLVAATIDGDHGFPQTALARFTRTGQPDPTFGRGGRVRLRRGGNFVPLQVLAQPDGGILLVGTVGGYAYFYYQPQQLAIVRLLPDGSRDRSFGTNGVVVWNPPWRAATEWMDVFPGLVLPQPGGRLLVAANVDERTLGVSPGASPDRVVLARFDPDGSVDESFGRAGVIEGPDGQDFFSAWAALPDGRIVALSSRNEGPGHSSWWLHRFTADGAADSTLGTNGSVRLGLNVLDGVNELLPARDGSLVMLGTVDPAHPAGSAAAARRIMPAGQLDARFGTACGRSGPRAGTTGGAATPDGGIFATARGFVRHARIDSFVFRYGPDGCVADRPLRLRALYAGPPLLQPRRTALVGAAYDNGLALIRIRR